MRRLLIVLIVLTAVAADLAAQIQAGDVLFASTTGYRALPAKRRASRRVRTSYRSPRASTRSRSHPSATARSSAFPGTQYVIAAHGLAASYSIWLLDFSASISAPLAYQLGGAPLPNQTAGVTSLGLDRLTGDVYFLQGSNIGRISGPISTSSTISPTFFVPVRPRRKRSR